MKTLILAVLLAVSALAGSTYQHYTAPGLDVYVDFVPSHASKVPGARSVAGYVEVSFSTLDYRIYGFSFNIAITAEDGTVNSIHRNVAIPDAIGTPAVLQLTVSGTPTKIVLSDVQPLVTTYAVTLTPDN